MSDEPGEQPLVPRLRAVIAAKDEQIASLTAGLETALERIRRQDLRKYSVNLWDLDSHPAAELRKRPTAPRDDRIFTDLRIAEHLRGQVR